MRKRVGVMALAAAGALVFGGTYAKAADFGVVPTKLIVVDKLAAASKAKAVFVAKDVNITKGPGTDVGDISVVLNMEYDNGAEVVTGSFDVPAGESDGTQGWLVNKETVAKFVNKNAPAGVTGTKVTVIKEGNLVKLVGKNLGDTPLDILSASSAEAGTAYTEYCITNGGEENCYCSSHTCTWKLIAGDTGAKLVCKGGAADPACSAGAPRQTLSFITGLAGGSCGAVKSGGSGGAVRKSLTCGGLNIGGGQSTVAEGPTPDNAETQMTAKGVGPVLTVSSRSAAQTGSNNTCSATGCQFGPYLPIASAGTSTCVRNVFSSGATGTVNDTTGTFTGTFPLTSNVFLTGNGTTPCPKCIGGFCDATWTAGTGNPYPDSGKVCTAINASGNTYDCAPPAATFLGPITVDLDPITTGTASFSDAGGLFCPSQANTGAFGCAGDGSAANGICPGGNVAPLIDYIEEVGTPAGVLSATPAAGTLASVFCIPTVGGALGFLVNSAGNLAGPGATSLPGTLALLP